jgi:elongation factor Ts
LEQQYVKDTDLTVQDLIHDMVAKTGESISVRRFTRYQLGGE